jgi:ankyrin repeat protein
VVELLISKGANVNAKNYMGQTPLSTAGSALSAATTENKKRNKAVIELLRKHGGHE